MQMFPGQTALFVPVRSDYLTNVFVLLLPLLFPQQPTEYFDMGIFLAFFVVVSLVCLILLIKIKLKQRRSQVRLANPSLARHLRTTF